MPIINDFEEKEIVVQLTTEDQSSIEIPLVKGQLDVLLLKSNQKAQIILESELGYLILHRQEFEGTEYLAVRKKSTLPQEELTDSGSRERFNLNEKLILTVIGPKGTEVDMLIRFI